MLLSRKIVLTLALKFGLSSTKLAKSGCKSCSSNALLACFTSLAVSLKVKFWLFNFIKIGFSEIFSKIELSFSFKSE